MSLDGAQENDLEQEIEIQRARQGNVIYSQENNSTENKARQGQSTNDNLIEGVNCSLHSKEPYTVRFINTTEKNVDVIWLNFTGEKVTYQTLTPQTAWSVHTYKTHPWIFRDSNNPNEKLVVKKQQVKSPFFECSNFLSDLKITREYGGNQRNSLLNGKKPLCVLIQLPVENLRRLALKTVCNSLPQKEDCFSLNVLPQQLQFELARMFL